jgi:MYXO-CTERM domain-containing protein
MKTLSRFVVGLVAVYLLLAAFPADSRADILAVPEVTQEQTQWCWAGVSRATLLYYGTDVAQCVIAEYTRTVCVWHDFGSEDCCVNPNLGCNYWNYNWGTAGSIEDILENWGIMNYGTGRALTQTEVGSETDNDRPFIIRWGWSGGGGHFLVGHGIEGNDMNYMDPWFGEGLKVATYSWVVSGGSHTWTHTNLITTNPTCVCSTVDACCDGCRPFDSSVSCDDNNPCTTNDHCQAGSCTGTPAGEGSACDDGDGNSCTAGSCQAGNCVASALQDGTACNDGNACTQTDGCVSGVCQGDNPVVCSASDQCHAVGNCNPATGVCSDPPADDGSACDDSNACTQTDTCQSGVCQGVDEVVCSASDQCHEVGICDTQNGTCSDPLKPDDAECDDGSLCTQSDSCQGGVCTGADPVVCTASDQCHDIGSCDPDSGTCSDPVKADGELCDDGDGCTQTDTCQAGVCMGGDPVVCSALDQCHLVGICDSQTGLCSNPEKADDTACDDGDLCSQSDSCQAGVCTGSNLIACTASDQCHDVGTCEPASGICSNPAKTDGTSCDDGDLCSQVDTCIAGVCSGDSPVECVAQDQCHEIGSCDPGSGLCSNPLKADATACDDGDGCTQSDTCLAGVCQAGDPVVCSALDQCHLAGVCDSQSGLCSNPEKADGTDCDDQSVCTLADTCQAGVCTGQALDCDDQNECTLDECDATEGCRHTEQDCDVTAGCNCSAASNSHGAQSIGLLILVFLGIFSALRRRH